MSDDRPAATSRRALLAAAAGAGVAFAATAAMPLTVSADDPDDVTKNADNPTTAVTSLTQQTADTDAFRASGAGAGTGVVGESSTGTGVWGSTDDPHRAGVVGVVGDSSVSSVADPETDLDSGIFGFADEGINSSGVWGESIGGIGTVGTGDLGVLASGNLALLADGFDGVVAFANGGTGVHAHVGTGDPSVLTPPLANTALLGTVTSSSQVGLEARGRVRFPSRSGRATIGAGKSSVAVTVSGVTTSNICFAVLNGSGSGRIVRAVIPSTNKITIYLNGTVSSSTPVAWLVLG